MAKTRSLRISRDNTCERENRSLQDDNHQGEHCSTNGNSTARSQHPSELRQNTQQQSEGRTYEYVVEDPDGKRTRGKTVLANIWNLPTGHRIVVGINRSNQPIGDEAGVLGHFCGTIARNGGLCSLSYTRWDYLKKGNKGNNQVLILNEVYLECHKHKHKNEASITDQIKEIASQQEHIQGSSINEDPVSQVLGKDQYGRVRGFGLGVKPSDLSVSSNLHCGNSFNMSTSDETTSMYFIRQLKDEMQSMKSFVAKQGRIIEKQQHTITKLKRKIRNSDVSNSSDLSSSADESQSEEDYDQDDNE